jgi:hypothetical protein
MSRTRFPAAAKRTRALSSRHLRDRARSDRAAPDTRWSKEVTSKLQPARPSVGGPD